MLMRLAWGLLAGLALLVALAGCASEEEIVIRALCLEDVSGEMAPAPWSSEQWSPHVHRNVSALNATIAELLKPENNRSMPCRGRVVLEAIRLPKPHRPAPKSP